MIDDKAINALREALRFSPDNIPLRTHLAETLMEALRLDEAREEFQQVLAHEPGNAGVLVALASIFLDQNRAEEAAAKASDAIRSDARNARAHLVLSRAQWQLGLKEKAQKSYQLAKSYDANLADKEYESEIFQPDEERPTPARAGAESWSNGWSSDQNDDENLFAESGLEMERPKISFAEIGGMDALKEEIRVNIIYPFLHPEVYAAYGKKTGGGILLFGPPGCGKTYIARATAGECNAGFLVVGIEDVLDMWMGNSERKLHQIFESARRSAPTVLFFDELDALAAKRSDSSARSSVVNQFLAETDGAKGDNSQLLIIGATNSPWHVDSAFRRPGRFDKVIFVPPPDQKARVEILKIHCAGKPVENLDYEKIAARMKQFSGADIAATCEAAAEIGLRETLKTGKMRQLNNNDFLTALKTVRPTTTEWLASAKNYALYANQTGLYDAVAEYLQRAQKGLD